MVQSSTPPQSSGSRLPYDCDTIIDHLRRRRGLISSTETMQILGCSRKSLCAWVKAGRIPAYRIGKDNKFDPHDVANFLNARRIGTPLRSACRPPQRVEPPSTASMIG